MKKYEKIKELKKQILSLKDDFQLHKAGLDGWDTKMEKATLEFQAKQLEYNTAAARKQTILENITEHLDILEKKIAKLEKGQKEDVNEANARKISRKEKAKIKEEIKRESKKENKEISEQIKEAKEEFIEKVAKMEEVPEEKAEPSEPQELNPPPEGWATTDDTLAGTSIDGSIEFEVRTADDGTIEIKTGDETIEQILEEEKIPEEVIPEDEPIHEKNAVVAEQKDLSESLGDAKQSLNDNIEQLENIKQEWIDEYKAETGRNAIWRGEITKGFKDFCKEVLGIEI